MTLSRLQFVEHLLQGKLGIPHFVGTNARVLGVLHSNGEPLHYLGEVEDGSAKFFVGHGRHGSCRAAEL